MEENGINRKNTVLLNCGMGIPFESSSSKNQKIKKKYIKKFKNKKNIIFFEVFFIHLISILSLFCINDYCHLDVTIVTSLTTFHSTRRHNSLTPLLGRETSFMVGPKTLSLVAVSAKEVSKSVLKLVISKA